MSPQQLIAEVRKRLEAASPVYGEDDSLSIKNSRTVRNLTTDLALLTDALEIAIKALGMVDQLEALPLPDAKTLLKKHNVMATFAREAQTKITELIAKRGEA